MQKLLEEGTTLRLESVEVAGKSQAGQFGAASLLKDPLPRPCEARKNLLSVLVDADIMLDSSLRICDVHARSLLASLSFACSRKINRVRCTQSQSCCKCLHA